jgi:tetratricopeptide (TPR) repeat protein
MPRSLIFALTGALITACATTAPEEQAPPETAPASAVAPAPAPEVPERPFPEDSVYPLLVAEFALRRREYGVALDNYMSQSRILRDAGVSAHTTHLTQFMRRESEALEASQLWVELEPDNLEARNTLSALLIREGRPLEALPHMAQVQRLGGEARFPALLSNFEELDDQQRAELVQGINTLATEWPDNIQLLLTQALILAEFNQFPQSLAKLDKLYSIEPYQHQALLLEVRVLITLEDPKPFARLERALEDNPDDQQLRLQYARILTSTDMAAAREQFEILSAQSPRDGDLLLSLALINREIGDDLAAKAYLRQLLALQQRMNEAHYYLGRIAEDEGDLEGALYQYGQVEGQAEFLSAASRSGQILIKRGELRQVSTTFDEKRQRNPDQSEPLYSLEADLFTQAGEMKLAMAVLNRALEIYPESDNLLYARSMLAEQQGDLSMMEADLRNIIQRDPDNATALNALGYTLANRTDRYSEAYDLIARALELQPNEPAILDSMGWVLYRKGKYQEALNYLTRAYADFPDPEVAAHLGEVLWVSGDTEAATTIWQGALMKAPEHEVLLDTLQRLGVEDLRAKNAPLPPAGQPEE